MNIANLIPISPDEKVTSMIRVPEFDEEKYLVMVTRQGIIKRIELNAYNTSRKGGLIALELNEGDELAWVRMTDGNSQVIIATKKGMAIRFNETSSACPVIALVRIDMLPRNRSGTDSLCI